MKKSPNTQGIPKNLKIQSQRLPRSRPVFRYSVFVVLSNLGTWRHSPFPQFKPERNAGYFFAALPLPCFGLGFLAWAGSDIGEVS